MPTEEKPKYQFSDPMLDAIGVIDEQVGSIRKVFNFVIVFIIGVMLIGFVSILLITVQIVFDSWTFKSTLSQELRQLKIQEDNIENTVTQQGLILEELKSIREDVKKLKIQ